MGRLTASAAFALALAASMVMFAAGAADGAEPAKAAGQTGSARTSASLPKTVLKIRSLEWQPRSGSVAVTARVKCTGRGTFRWQVSLQQKKARDKGSATVPCDGDGFRSTIILNAHQTRFHPGNAEFGHGSITTGGDVGVGFFIVEQVRISPR
ncbi:MAG: hypothetical protein ACJ73L_03865 [Actinomycetes bacterium]